MGGIIQDIQESIISSEHDLMMKHDAEEISESCPKSQRPRVEKILASGSLGECHRLYVEDMFRRRFNFVTLKSGENKYPALLTEWGEHVLEERMCSIHGTRSASEFALFKRDAEKLLEVFELFYSTCLNFGNDLITMRKAISSAFEVSSLVENMNKHIAITCKTKSEKKALASKLIDNAYLSSVDVSITGSGLLWINYHPKSLKNEKEMDQVCNSSTAFQMYSTNKDVTYARCERWFEEYEERRKELGVNFSHDKRVAKLFAENIICFNTPLKEYSTFFEAGLNESFLANYKHEWTQSMALTEELIKKFRRIYE